MISFIDLYFFGLRRDGDGLIEAELDWLSAIAIDFWEKLGIWDWRRVNLGIMRMVAVEEEGDGGLCRGGIS